MGEYAGFFQPMLGLVLLQLGLVAAQWVYKNVLKRKKDPKQVLLSHHRPSQDTSTTPIIACHKKAALF